MIRKLFYVTAIVVLLVLIGIDLASTLQSPTPIIAIPVSQLKPNPSAITAPTRVAYVRSDDSFMATPKPLTAELSSEEIIAMTYQVLDLSGDLPALLFPGAKITIKPNVVEPANLGNGVNTDPRVVEGLIRWMEKNGPGNLHYTIAEGAGGWLAPEWKNTKYNSGGAPVVDGFAQAGYRDMVKRLAADGIQAPIVDSDFGTTQEPLKGIRLAPVPAFIDFPEYESYWVHEAILDPDVLINVPVMKTHTPQITVCLKNYIGIAAGAKYGTYKGMGGPDPGDPKLHRDWPGRNSIEHEIIDLASIAPSDYCLVDAIVCKERAKTATDPSVRRNMLIAGKDLVAVDTVCAQLMGQNPDSIPIICDAAREGLGIMDQDKITTIGEHSLEDSSYYFERPPVNYQGNRGHFSMGNRVWLLNAVEGADLDAVNLGIPDEQIIATPGAGGWTEPVLFSDDYIDIEAFYGNRDQAVFYAFCWVTVPEEQDAELWLNHDESCAVWIDGKEVFRNYVRYQEPALPGSSTKTIHLRKGRQTLLVKLVDTYRTAPFVLNLCRILPNSLPAGKATYPNLSNTKNYQRYDGTRILGLQFDAGTTAGIPHWSEYGS